MNAFFSCAAFALLVTCHAGYVFVNSDHNATFGAIMRMASFVAAVVCCLISVYIGAEDSDYVLGFLICVHIVYVMGTAEILLPIKIKMDGYKKASRCGNCQLILRLICSIFWLCVGNAGVVFLTCFSLHLFETRDAARFVLAFFFTSFTLVELNAACYAYRFSLNGCRVSPFQLKVTTVASFLHVCISILWLWFYHRSNRHDDFGSIMLAVDLIGLICSNSAYTASCKK
jgi:hypothetical protein